MKLPEIRIAHYKNIGGSINHSREASINYEDKKEKLRAKLEMLYHIKMPKYKSMKQRDEVPTNNKPPLLIKKHNGINYASSLQSGSSLPAGSYLIPSNNGLPVSRP